MITLVSQNRGKFSPMATIAYEILPFTTTISLSVCDCWQTRPFPNYIDPQNKWINKYLENANSKHVVLSLQHILAEGIKLSVETYCKRYKNIVVRKEIVYSSNRIFRSDSNLPIGRREFYGIEFFLQEKQVTDYYDTASISISKTEGFDLHIPKRVDRYVSDYDNPVIVTIVGGKIVKSARSWFSRQTFFIKYLSYIVPISDEMEVSCRYRYQTGGSYTPYYFTNLVQKREGGTHLSDGVWQRSNDINSLRFPYYNRFDFQWINRFYMNKWNINAYLALMNFFDRKNVFFMYTVMMVQLKQFVNFGFFV